MKKKEKENKQDNGEKTITSNPPSTLFQKGRAKTGGRKKGTKNKVTKSIRKILEDQLLPRLETIGDTIDKIKDPGDKAAAVAHFLPFLVPRYSNTTINADIHRDISTEQYIKEMNGKYDKSDIKVDTQTLNIINNG